jgi:hypothetical protein
MITAHRATGLTLDDLYAELRRLSAQIEEVRKSLPPSLGSLRDAAKILHCDPSTVYRAFKRGEVAGRQIGGRIVVDLAALRPPTEEEAIEASAWRGGGR